MNSSTKAVEDVPAKVSRAIKPASSAASKYRSQYADMNQDACGAGASLAPHPHVLQPCPAGSQENTKKEYCYS